MSCSGCCCSGQEQGRSQVCPSLSCTRGEEGTAAAPGPKVQGRWVGTEECCISPYSPAWVETTSYNWVITATPRQLTPSTKLLQSVINDMIRTENGSEVSNSFVQGLTLCVPFAWPSAAHSLQLPWTHTLQDPTDIGVRWALTCILRSLRFWTWCCNSLEVHCNLLFFLRLWWF